MKSDKRAMLVMPGYGPIAPSAAGSFWRATATPDNLYRSYQEGSLLCQGFNVLWCNALNMLVDGKQIDYFAMQHADVGAEDGWLDTLIDEMESRDLDVLGAVVPIKDMRGLTSIALDRPDGDPWRPLCRLTMAEVFRLPETFTSDDVGHPLLLNTGLWVCRFDPKWVLKGNLHFTINDAIIFDKNLKRFVAKCEPEDWNFSRQLHKLGLKIGATRKVQVIHRGQWEFGNSEPWGNYHYDSEWNDKSVVSGDGFRFPHDVDGWLTFGEGRKLADLARGKRVLEIGSYCGLSTICLAQTAEHVVSVDTHDGRGTAVPRDTLGQLHRNLDRYGVSEKVTANTCTAREFTELFGGDDRLFDLVFIDGGHDYESVKSDIEDALSLVSSGGLIVFHDYHSGKDPDVRTAVDEFLSAGAELVSTHDSLAVVKPPAAILLEA